MFSRRAMGVFAHVRIGSLPPIVRPVKNQNIMKSAYETYQEADVPGRIRDVQNRLTETAKNVSNVTDDYVHDHPWQTVAIAAVIGCVIGFLIGHRE